MIDHHLGTVISQSFAAPEAGFPSAASIMKLRSAYVNASKNGVTVLAGTGDAGATGAKTLTAQGFAATFFLHRGVDWPATDPLVTAMGGTQLHLDATGNRFEPDTVWNDTPPVRSRRPPAPAAPPRCSPGRPTRTAWLARWATGAATRTSR